jgi:hypothetical protein
MALLEKLKKFHDLIGNRTHYFLACRPCVNWSMLKYVIKRIRLKMTLIGFIWLRIGSNGRLLTIRKSNFWFHNGQGVLRIICTRINTHSSLTMRVSMPSADRTEDGLNFSNLRIRYYSAGGH